MCFMFWTENSVMDCTPRIINKNQPSWRAWNLFMNLSQSYFSFAFLIRKYRFNVKISVSDPSHFDMNPDPDPRIHLFLIMDPDPRIHVWKKWIRIRVQGGSGSEYLFLIFFIFFIKKFMSDKLQYLFLLPPKFRKGISQIKNIWFYFLLYIVLVCFGATRIQINASLSGSESGSETLHFIVINKGLCLKGIIRPSSPSTTPNRLPPPSARQLRLLQTFRNNQHLATLHLVPFIHHIVATR